MPNGKLVVTGVVHGNIVHLLELFSDSQRLKDEVNTLVKKVVLVLLSLEILQQHLLLLQELNKG